jgi:hypothetical protein
LELSAKLVRAMPWHGELQLEPSAERCFAPRPHGLRWVERRSNEKLLACFVPGRRWYGRKLARVRRDNFLRLHLRTDGRPSRGCNPSRPTGPCPERCRCRSTPARNNHRAHRHTARNRSSRRNKRAEHQYQLQVAPELLAPIPGRQPMPSYRIES